MIKTRLQAWLLVAVIVMSIFGLQFLFMSLQG